MGLVRATSVAVENNRACSCNQCCRGKQWGLFVQPVLPWKTMGLVRVTSVAVENSGACSCNQCCRGKQWGLFV